MLPRSHRQEALSRAYVRAVAAKAGVLCDDVVQDFGIDMFLHGVEVRNGGYWDTGPQLDVQIKSTTRAEVRDDSVIHDLEVRTYNLLREENAFGRPRILVLVVLPEDEAEWLEQSVEQLIVRRCGFWVSFRGADPTTAHTTLRVAIPRRNVFSPDELQQLLSRIKQGVMP